MNAATPETPRRKRSFAEIIAPNGSRAPRCRRCRNEPATHGVTLTIANLGSKGAPVSRIKGPLCESCAVDVHEVIAKALA